MNKPVLAVAFAVGVLGMAVFLRGGESYREPHAAEAPKGKVTVTRRYAPETVLSITPNAAVEKTSSGQELSPRGSPLIQEYRQARELGALFMRLDAKSSRSPEENWLLAEILERCGQRLYRPPGVEPPPSREAVLKTFADSLSEKDPMRDRRVEAYKTVVADRCEGVRAMRPNEARELRQAAAAEGEIKARIRLAREEVFWTPKPATPAAAKPDVARHLELIREAIESGEPYAISQATWMLSYPGTNLSVGVGPHELPLQLDVFSRAATALGCELGVPCGPGSDNLLDACAFHRACDVRDLRDYYFFHAMSPQQSQLMHQYVEALRAVVRSRDWSHFAMRPGKPTLPYSVKP